MIYLVNDFALKIRNNRKTKKGSQFGSPLVYMKGQRYHLQARYYKSVRKYAIPSSMALYGSPGPSYSGVMIP